MFNITTALVGATLALSLSACGGGGGGSSAPTSDAQSSRSTAAKLPLVIALDGDSTNAGCNADSNSQCLPTWPSDPALLMQADFDAAFGKGVVQVVNISIPGSAFQYDLQTGGPVTVPLASRLAQMATPPAIVISNSEINDQYVLHELPADYGPYELQWIQTVRSFGAVPILEEPNPICQPVADLAMTAQLIGETHLIASEQTVSVLPLTAAFEAQPNWCSTLLGSDFTHPNAAGYAFKESQYFPTLLPIIKAALAR